MNIIVLPVPEFDDVELEFGTINWYVVIAIAIAVFAITMLLAAHKHYKDFIKFEEDHDISKEDAKKEFKKIHSDISTKIYFIFIALGMSVVSSGVITFILTIFLYGRPK